MSKGRGQREVLALQKSTTRPPRMSKAANLQIFPETKIYEAGSISQDEIGKDMKHRLAKFFIRPVNPKGEHQQKRSKAVRDYSVAAPCLACELTGSTL